MYKPLFKIIALLAFTLTATFSQAQTVKLAYDSDHVSLDPQEQLSGGILQYSHVVFDPLVRFNKQIGHDPRLATSWEQVDEKTMRFHLREGVKFHSGNTLTGADVKWTVERLKESGDFKGIFEPLKEVVVRDDLTIDLVTTEPYPLLLNLATYIFPMDSAFYSGDDESGKSKARIAKDGTTFASQNASGTGPFIVTERQHGVKVVYKAFDGYWDENRGNVKEIILTPIAEGPTRVAALLSGDVDFILPVPPVDHERIDETEGTQLVAMPGTRIITFHLNQNRVEAFKDKRVRQAIVNAVNNAGIAKKIMKGFATPAGQLSPAGYAGYVDSIKPRYDLEKAKALMKEAGQEEGFTVTMMAPNDRYVNDEKIAQAVAAMLAKINIKVDLKTVPKAQYWDEFDARAADIMMIGWHSDTEDTANFFEYLAMCEDKETGRGQYNANAYCNPELDQLVNQANTEVDPAKRAGLLQQVEQIVHDDAAMITLHWQNLGWGASSRLKNVEDVLNVMNFPYWGGLVVE